jgi:hypothetical protein
MSSVHPAMQPCTLLVLLCPDVETRTGNSCEGMVLEQRLVIGCFGCMTTVKFMRWVYRGARATHSRRCLAETHHVVDKLRHPVWEDRLCRQRMCCPHTANIRTERTRLGRSEPASGWQAPLLHWHQWPARDPCHSARRYLLSAVIT